MIIVYCYQSLTIIMVTGMETVGLFRRTAAKARVEAIKEEIEANPGKWTVRTDSHLSEYKLTLHLDDLTL